MPVFLRPERSGHIDATFHDAAALVIEAQNAGYHICSTLCRFQGRSAFFLIPDSSSLAALACGEACGNERLLLHTWLCLNCSSHAVQIPDFISLICCECDGLNQSVAAGRHPAVHSKSSGHISGQVAVVTVEALRAILIRLCDEGLHLHIAGRHQRTRYAVQIDALVTLIDVIGFQFRGLAIGRNNTRLDLQSTFELLREFLSTLRGSAQDAQAGFLGQIIFEGRIFLQNLRQGRYGAVFAGCRASIEYR